jgi:hypothetical protein
MGNLDIPKPGFKVEKERKRMTLGQKYDPNQRIEVQKVIVHPGEVRLIQSNDLRSTA